MDCHAVVRHMIPKKKNAGALVFDNDKTNVQYTG